MFNKILIFIFTATSFLNTVINANDSHEIGTIIILNGPSASGKSSIQNELQKKFSSLYLKVGIDTFFDALLPIPDLSFSFCCF